MEKIGSFGGPDGLKSLMMDPPNPGELSAELLAKIFKGGIPEKLRASLDSLFVPEFRVKFNTDPSVVVVEPQSIKDPSASTPVTRFPTRMFDIATGNLVGEQDLDSQGRYCVISHRWRVEAEYKDIQEARCSTFPGPGTLPSDVQLVRSLCESNIRKEWDFIKHLYRTARPNAQPEGLDIKDILGNCWAVASAKRRLKKARDNVEEATANLWLAEDKIQAYRQLAEKWTEKYGSAVKGDGGALDKRPLKETEVEDIMKVVSKIDREVVKTRASLPFDDLAELEEAKAELGWVGAKLREIETELETAKKETSEAGIKRIRAELKLATAITELVGTKASITSDDRTELGEVRTKLKEIETELRAAKNGCSEAESECIWAEVRLACVITEVVRTRASLAFGNRSELEKAKAELEGVRTKLKAVEIELRTAKDRPTTVEIERTWAQIYLAGVTTERVKAERELKKAEAEYGLTMSAANFLNDDTLKKMIRLLGKWRSVLKLEDLISEAHRIFESNFPGHNKCYLWIDTCCIDKKDPTEFSDSFSLMGEWYGNAEFCLVYMDAEEPARDSWLQFRRRVLRQETPPTSPTPERAIISLDDIEPSSLEWSTRAWTLQELVMSRATFYLLEKARVSRPVESLGSFYYLIPFINLYAKDSKIDEADLRAVVDQLVGSHGYDGQFARHVLFWIEAAHTSPPPSSSRQGRQPRGREPERWSIARELISLLDVLGLTFPKSLTRETARSQIAHAVRRAVEHGSVIRTLKLPTATGSADLNRRMTNLIRGLLKGLADEKLELIEHDRSRVAQLGRIQHLTEWRHGTRNTGFVAQSVLTIAADRSAAKPEDEAYALMGILGVSFPVCGAEGYPKALARLLDQVIITHQDISVFNWAGKDMGSPIRGRSLYPRSAKAFRHRQKAEKGPPLSPIAINSEISGSTEAYRQTMAVLDQISDHIKSRKGRVRGLDWTEKIIRFIQDSSFDTVKPELKALGQVIRYMNTKRSAGGAEEDGRQAPPTSGANGSPLLLRTPPSVTLSISSARRSIGMRLRRSDTSRQAPEAVPEAPGPEVPGLEAESSPTKNEEDVATYLEYLSKPEDQRLGLEKAREKLPNNDPDASSNGSSSTTLDRSGSFGSPATKRTLGTNEPGSGATPSSEQNPGNTSTELRHPIIVDNSGIIGLFDIQRVVIRFLDAKKLRAQIDRRASPGEKISGWCYISTGVAFVMVSFSCEASVLERELNAVDVIEAKTFSSPKKAEGGEAGGVESIETEGSMGLEEEMDDAQHQTGDEELVGEMLAFTRESQLHLVAGEWVLARLSGDSAADWFLCCLTLGSTHDQFYGYRIATDHIDFRNAMLEPALVNAWKAYKDRMKRERCSVLMNYLNHWHCEEKLEILSIGKKVGDGAPKLMMKDGSEIPVQALEETKQVAESSGGALGLAFMEELFGARAKQLEKNLGKKVLGAMPASLQAALVSLDKNASLLPAMIHAQIRVHML